jgi:hypothetical protein
MMYARTATCISNGQEELELGRTEHVVEYALRSEYERAEPDGRIAERHEGPVNQRYKLDKNEIYEIYERDSRERTFNGMG